VLYQPAKEEIKYFLNTQSGKTFIVVDPLKDKVIKNNGKNSIYYENSDKTLKGGLLSLVEDKNTEFLIPTDTNFSVVVPKIGANSNVIGNVSTVEKDEYLQALKTGVAHASGTAFPGEGGHIFLFAHSTDNIFNVESYNAVFYLLYKLEVGDEVNLFYKGKRFVYRVTGKEIVDPDKVEYLTKKTDKEFLTLQTCWPPGTTFKRQLVFAEPIVALP
jgi:sortase A